MPTAALRHSNINPLQFVPQQDYANETTLCFIWWEQIGGFVYWRLADTFQTRILKLVGPFKSMISFTFGRSLSSQQTWLFGCITFFRESAHRTDLLEHRIQMAVVYSYDPKKTVISH